MRWATLFSAIILASPVFGQDEPAPREETRPLLGGIPSIKFELTKTGYEVIMNQAAAEMVLKRLQDTDPEQLGDTIRKKKTLDRDDETRAQTEMIAVAVTKDMPRFMKELEEKIGPEGVVVKVMGAEKKPDRERPILNNLRDRLPPALKERAEKMGTIARIQPVFWTIRTRE